MDYGTFGSIFTVLVMVFFLIVVWWVFKTRSKEDFDEAANLVFDDEQQATQAKRQELSVDE